ncbi:fimbrial protein [Pseudomonas knackmussii]|uniref:fimbrial protein n=1 Tax=Pseudomonas knackmussii TaxID=65741 RepID=UPI003BC9A494
MSRVKATIAVLTALWMMKHVGTLAWADDCSDESNNDTVNLGVLTVSSNSADPVGTVLGSKETGAYNGGKRLAGCFRDYIEEWRYFDGGAAVDGVYQTTLPGLGVRVTHQDHDLIVPFDLPRGGSLANRGHSYVKVGLKVDVVKTGAMSSGQWSVPGGLLLLGKIKGEEEFAYLKLDAINVEASSCNVVTPSVNVDLGQHLKSDFNGIGSSGAVTNFQIRLQCDASMGVNVQLDGDATVGANGVLNLNGDSTASGVGVQISRNGEPVQFGQPINVGQSIAGTFPIDFEARYYQTTAQVTPGKGNATATYTVTYY